METKFTAGPWLARGRSIKQDLTCIGLDADAGATIATVPGGETSGPYFIENSEECLANACLLAVAPELFQALEEIEGMEGEERDEWDAVERVLPAIIAIARAALAKATP